ncbi:hypothetical protein BU24DRAFT_56798 [Aaosphaeria arxii CBS 175.79]|uniref:Uncharacterized protein n=1 Tax=Aaosphaeria arxii CBS 175.79 TaxID=1450172 RepID=A0A6A5XC47_9PLEO|nr:uncharacterized protein BU24DRAFT_56798 [Aaosphaeria arxii CBS 175.79]KAF2010354.1 hypothetical protein BU24DRAFT_56798 [Aaosphaeria arxii CBS 175.79]
MYARIYYKTHITIRTKTRSFSRSPLSFPPSATPNYQTYGIANTRKREAEAEKIYAPRRRRACIVSFPFTLSLPTRQFGSPLNEQPESCMMILLLLILLHYEVL